MKALSLYSGGCDGLSLAGSWVGIETMAMCECDPHCRAQLVRRHPDKPIFTYDTEVTCDALREQGIDPGDVDIVLASPPCQCASVAGARLGDADERNRWPECLRILRDIRPRWFMAENVPGLLSVNAGRLFGTILRELAEMGYDAGWGVWGASDVGAPHKRNRLCLVAYRDRMRQLQPEGRIQDVRGRVSNGGKGVADTKGAEQHRPVQNGYQAGRRRFADGGVVVNADHDGQSAAQKAGGSCAGKRDLQAGAVSAEQPSGSGRPQCDTVGLAKCSGLSRDDRRRPGQELADRHQGSRERPAIPTVGYTIDGISRRLVGQRWPAGRGEAQHEWEAPRTVKDMKYRAPLVKMLGNAVVPQWALIAISVIVEVEKSL